MPIASNTEVPRRRIRDSSVLQSTTTRRGFIARIGETGLLAAATVMMGASPASATYPCGCCNLEYADRSSLEWCLFGGDWSWTCPGCTCCEAYWAGASASNCC